MKETDIETVVLDEDNIRNMAKTSAGQYGVTKLKSEDWPAANCLNIFNILYIYISLNINLIFNPAFRVINPPSQVFLKTKSSPVQIACIGHPI